MDSIFTLPLALLAIFQIALASLLLFPPRSISLPLAQFLSKGVKGNAAARCSWVDRKMHNACT